MVRLAIIPHWMRQALTQINHDPVHKSVNLLPGVNELTFDKQQFSPNSHVFFCNAISCLKTVKLDYSSATRRIKPLQDMIFLHTIDIHKSWEVSDQIGRSTLYPYPTPVSGCVIAMNIHLSLFKVIRCYNYRSTLFQAIACCLTAPSHYLNQRWFISTCMVFTKGDSKGNVNRYHMCKLQLFKNTHWL